MATRLTCLREQYGEALTKTVVADTRNARIAVEEAAMPVPA